MNRQISIDEFLRQQEPEPKIVIPVSRYDGEKVYQIPQDVWETRCIHCEHKNGKENVQIPMWAIHKAQYEKIIPCRIMAILGRGLDEMPGECMSFAPRIETYGICYTCRHDSHFNEGFCDREEHAPERRVYYGGHYGGDEKNRDYWGRHRFCTCDDYEPNQYVMEVKA